MTYSDELDHLTRAVADLIEKPEQSLDELGVQAALNSRKALLGLLTVQMAEAAPLDRSLTKPDLQRLAEHPVAAFIGTLREYPRPHGEIAPSVLYSQPQETSAGALWLEVGRRSTLAQAEWQGTGKPLTDEQAWTVVGDAAALAIALVRLDEDLYGAARRTGCDDLVRTLAPPAPLRLGMAGSEVKRLAGQGTRTDTPDRWRTPGPRIRPVARDSDLPRALETLAAVLRHARVLKPEHVAQVAIAIARVDLRLQGSASELARELAVAARTPRRVACTFYGDRRPLFQAAELNRWASRRLSDVSSPPVIVHERLLECVAALHAAAQRQLQAGHWLVPEPNDDARYVWRPWSHALKEPEALSSLHAAATLRPEHRFGLTSASWPRDVGRELAAAASTSRRFRPTSPQHRPSRAR